MELEENFNLKVGMRVRQVREAHHMSREQFGKLCSISDSFLAAVERGEKSITSKTLYKIGANAHVSVDYLIFGKENGFQEDMVLGLLEDMDSAQKESAIRILSEFTAAVRSVPAGGLPSRE